VKFFHMGQKIEVGKRPKVSGVQLGVIGEMHRLHPVHWSNWPKGSQSVVFLSVTLPFYQVLELSTAELGVKDLLNFIFKLSIDLHRRGRCGFPDQLIRGFLVGA